MRGKFSRKSMYRSLSRVHARERIALGRCFKCQHEAGFLSFPRMRMSQVVCKCVYTYVYVTCSRLKYCSSFPRRCTTRYCWKHRSENFSVWIYLRVRPYGYTLVPLHSGIPWHSRNPHPTRKVGINVNRMSTYVVRERRLCDDVLKVLCFSLWFIHTQSSLSKDFLFLNVPILLVFPSFSKYWNVRKGKSKGLILKFNESKLYTWQWFFGD